MVNHQLCEGCYFHYESKETIDYEGRKTEILTYISKSKKSYNILKFNMDELLSSDHVASYLFGYVYEKEEEPDIWHNNVNNKKEWVLSINSLYSYSNKGSRQGTLILGWTCKKIIEKFPYVTSVILDDATGVTAPINIYYKLGFNVPDDDTWISWNDWIVKNNTLPIYERLDYPPDERRQINIDDLLVNIENYLKIAL